MIHDLTHRQKVLHGNHKAGVSDEPVPQSQDIPDRLHEHAASKEHEVETGHQVAQAEDVDPRGAGDEDEAEHQPEEVAEHKHFHHVKVTSVGQADKGNVKIMVRFTSKLAVKRARAKLSFLTCSEGSYSLV